MIMSNGYTWLWVHNIVFDDKSSCQIQKIHGFQRMCNEIE